MAFQNVISDNSFQNLTRVPDEILSMETLRMLYMDGNNLQSLPTDFFERLPNLYWLDLRGNKLETLPASIGHHKCLENLLLQNNRIRKLPNELGLVPNLKVLQLTDNPLEYPSKKIIDSGVEGICKFLKEEFIKKSNPFENGDDDDDEEEDFFSVTTVSTPSVHTVKKRVSTKIEKPPPIIITALSKPPPIIQEDNSKEKKVHRITRSSSKISVHSHYTGKNPSWNIIDLNKQNIRIEEAHVREIWMNKLKDLIMDQEKILQQETTLKNLSSWRQDKKNEPERNSLQELRRVPPTPFDTNPTYNQLMSKNVVLKNVEKLVAAQNSSKKRTQDDVDRLISDVILQLKCLEQKVKETGGDDNANPSEKLEKASSEIEAIINLHKKIARIQSENNLR